MTLTVNKKDMTFDIANKYLAYDPLTGILTRKYKYAHNVIEGRRACRPSPNKHQDHLDVTLCGRNYPAHRMIWLLQTGRFPEGHIDHINHDETDNRWVNLREVTQAENNRNLSKRSDNTSGTTGVWIHSKYKHKKYMAEIRDTTGKKKVKGFKTLEEAINQRKEWEVEFGYHPNHGKVKP